MFHCVVELFGGLGHHEMASIGDRDEVCVGNLVRQFAVEVGRGQPIPPAADHERGVVDIAQSVGGVVSEAGVALSRENLLGDRLKTPIRVSVAGCHDDRITHANYNQDRGVCYRMRSGSRGLAACQRDASGAMPPASCAGLQSTLGVARVDATIRRPSASLPAQGIDSRLMR
jgi:hypothetical protein